MKIEISYRDLAKTDAIESHIQGRGEHDLSRFADRLTRVEVHVGDLNGTKGGADDKRCMVEVRPAGADPIAVESTGGDLYAVISETVAKAERALDKRFGRAEDHRTPIRPVAQ